MSVKRELGMAKEYLIKRLADTEDALNVPLITPSYNAGNEYLKKKIIYTKEAIQIIEDIISSNQPLKS